MYIITNLKIAYLRASTIFHRYLSQFKSQTEDNATIVVHRALSYHGIKVTYKTVSEYLKTHPNYPSFKSICDFFEDNNVLCYPLKYDESDLYELNYPFVAHFKDSGGKIIFVFSINKEIVVYSDSLKWKKVMKTFEFLEKWDGAVIVLEPDESSGEQEYREKQQSEIINSSLIPATILVFCLVLVYGIIINKPFLSDALGPRIIFFSMAHLAGLVFSILLLRQELNLKTKFTDKLCHIATNADCDAVTKSKASKIFGSISWADAGVVFFSGGLIAIIQTQFTSAFNIVLLFAIAALPYSLFSILYQGLIIKKWCPFCLSVQSIIILEAVGAFRILNIEGITILDAFPVVLIYSIVFVAVLLIKYLFIAEREKDQAKQELLKMKREPEMFLYKLQKGNYVEIPDNEYALVFGNKQSNIHVSVFLSFHCSACARRFDSILKLLEKSSKLKVQLIFSHSKDEVCVKLMKKLFKLMIADHREKILEELRIWYKTEIKERFKLYQDQSVDENIIGLEEMTGYNSMLFKTGKVLAVPSVFINGYSLPMNYNIEDIRYHTSELSKLQTTINEIEA